MFNSYNNLNIDLDSMKYIDLNKITTLSYSKKDTFSFEELYRIAYNFVLHYSYNKDKYLNSTESEINYFKNYNSADNYLKQIYNILDSRICIFNNINEICNISLYAIKTKKSNLDYSSMLKKLCNKKKYKQNLIILCLQKKNINDDLIKKILFNKNIKIN